MDERAVVLANSAAFSNRDVEGMLRFFAPDAVAVDLRPSGFGEYHGHEALRAYYGGIFDNAAELHEELEIVSAADGCVVADCHTRVRLASTVGSGDLEVAYAMMLLLVEGRITRLEVHADRTSALEASAARP